MLLHHAPQARGPRIARAIYVQRRDARHRHGRQCAFRDLLADAVASGRITRVRFEAENFGELAAVRHCRGLFCDFDHHAQDFIDRLGSGKGGGHIRREENELFQDIQQRLPKNTVVTLTAADGWIEVNGVKYGDMHNIRTAMNRGAFDFLIKPLDFEDFESTLRRTHDAVRAAREAVTARRQLSAIQQELERASSPSYPDALQGTIGADAL